LIEKHIAVFEQISPCPFETEMVEVGLGTKRETKVYYLDSDQANLLIGLTRNTGITVELKANVVKSFKLAKQQIAITSKQLTMEESTTIRYRFLLENSCAIADLLGYSEGHKRKEALEIGVKIEQDTGIRVTPSFLTHDPQAVNPDQTLSPFHGTHAAMVAVGSKGYSVSNIAHLFGLTSGTVINNILVKEGFQTKICKGKYVPTEKAKLFCNVRRLASGKHEGEDIIIEWLYDSNKVLRDVIEKGVAEIEAKRQQKLKPKTNVNDIVPSLQRYYRDVN
jgi:hypothetical protein